MSKAEAKALIDCGRYWRAKVGIEGDVAERDKLITDMNTSGLKDLDIKVGRGYQPADPVVKVGNKTSYLRRLGRLGCGPSRRRCRRSASFSAMVHDRPNPARSPPSSAASSRSDHSLRRGWPRIYEHGGSLRVDRHDRERPRRCDRARLLAHLQRLLSPITEIRRGRRDGVYWVAQVRGALRGLHTRAHLTRLTSPLWWNPEKELQNFPPSIENRG
jgi:hypothetical protein